MKKPKNVGKIEIRPKKQTQIKIYNLKIEDYKKQIENLKRNKSKYEYSHYRYLYLRLYSTIADLKKRLLKKMGEK